MLITSKDAVALAPPLMRALNRAGAAWGCFFTNDGVELLSESGTVEALSGAVRAVACESSWERAGAGGECPIERGSQTINSAMMAEAARLISL